MGSPSAQLTSPLAEEQRGKTRLGPLFLLIQYPLHHLITLEHLLDPLRVNLVLLQLLSRWLPSCARRGMVVRLLDGPNLDNVILHLSEAFEPFQE